MSYGWLTESSCIPKPGKEIPHVSPQSLKSLQSLLWEGATKSQRGLAGDRSKLRHGKKKEYVLSKLPRGKGGNDTGGCHVVKSNPYDAIEEKLEKKSRIYDALVSGKLNPQCLSEELSHVDDKACGRRGLRDEESCLDLHALYQGGGKKQREEEVVRTREVDRPVETSDSMRDAEVSDLRQKLRDRLKHLRQHQNTSIVSMEGESSSSMSQRAKGND